MSNFTPQQMSLSGVPKQDNFLSQATSSLLNGALSSLGGIPGALISGGLSTLFGNISANSQLKNQMKLMNHQFDLQKQMFDYTSEYNSPVNQVQRYKDAKLNPNLLTGQNQIAGSTGSVSSGNAIAPIANTDFAQSMQIASMNDNVNADTELKKSQADLNAYLGIKEMYEGLQGKEKARVASRMADLSIDIMEEGLLHSQTERGLMNEQKATEIAKQYNISTESALNIMRGITESVEPYKVIMDILEGDSRISERNANIAYLGALKEYVVSHKEWTDIDAEGKKIINDINNLEKWNWHNIKRHELTELSNRAFRHLIVPAGTNWHAFGVGGGSNNYIKLQNPAKSIEYGK